MGALRGRRRFSEREQLQLILRLPSGQIDQAGLLAETHWPEAKIKVAVNACHEPRAVARPCDDFLKAFTMSSRDSLKARSHSRTLPVAADAGAALMPALPVHASAGEDYAADPQRRRFLFPLARRRPSARVNCARSRGREAFFFARPTFVHKRQLQSGHVDLPDCAAGCLQSRPVRTVRPPCSCARVMGPDEGYPSCAADSRPPPGMGP